MLSSRISKTLPGNDADDTLLFRGEFKANAELRQRFMNMCEQSRR